MNTVPELDAEWIKRINPGITRDPCFWVGLLWAFVLLLQVFAKSSASSLAAFTACVFFIAAHERLSKKRMNALLDWIEYQKSKEKPQS